MDTVARRVQLNNGALLCADRPSASLVVQRSAVTTTTAERAFDNLDGVHVEWCAGDAPAIVDTERDVTHPNGAVSLDHIVITTDSIERTSAAVERVLGLPLLRVREVGDGSDLIRQGFHRFADPAGDGSSNPVRGCIIEVVENPHTRSAAAVDVQAGLTGDTPVGGGRASVFGAVAVTDRLVEFVDQLPDGLMSTPRPAVQPGRSIATVRSAAELPIAFAFMSPEPPRR